MAIAKLVLWPQRPKAFGGVTLIPILMRLAHDNKTKYFPTGYYCRKEDWNSEAGNLVSVQGHTPKIAKRGTNSFVNAKEANNALTDLVKLANKIIDEQKKGLTFATFERDYTLKPQSKPSTFVEFANQVLAEYRDPSKPRHKTAGILVCTMNSLRQFDSKLDTRVLEEINAEYIGKYINFCEGKGNQSNTIRMRLAQIRSLLRQAIKRGYCTEDTYPFVVGDSVSIGANQNAKGTENNDGKISVSAFEEKRTKQSKYLNLTEFEAFCKHDFSNNPRLQMAQKLFIASVALWGINWQDMAKLTKDNIVTKREKDKVSGYTDSLMLTYQRSKTAPKKKKKDNALEIPINEDIQQLLDWFAPYCYGDYLFPIINRPISKYTFQELARKRGLTQEDIDAEKRTHNNENKAESTERTKRTFATLKKLYKEVIPADMVDDAITNARKAFNKDLDAIAKELNFDAETREQLSSYTARHTYAMQLITFGASIAEISSALNHRDEEITKSYVQSLTLKEKNERLQAKITFK